MGHGVSACATCDDFFFKDKDLVVVDGGERRWRRQPSLPNSPSKVTVAHRRDKFRTCKNHAGPRSRKTPQDSFVWDTIVDEYTAILKPEESPAFDSGMLKPARPKLQCGGLFIAIGHEPNSKLFARATRTKPHRLHSQPTTAPRPKFPRLCLRRRTGPHLPPGRHRRRHRLHGRHRRGAVFKSQEG